MSSKRELKCTCLGVKAQGSAEMGTVASAEMGSETPGLSVLPYTSSLCGLGQPHSCLSFPINKRICRVCIQITCFTTPLSAMSWSYPIMQNIGEKSFQYQQTQDFSTVWKVPFTKLSQCSLSGANLSKHKMKKLNKIVLCFLHILL